ncbi:MAG: hypothetical protein JXD22_05060 [Sedimentisphaerales bacterium]|nr:hypothetical protein [Sedimentisphaerales bacterium]
MVISCGLILLDIILSIIFWNYITLSGVLFILICPVFLLCLCLNSESHPMRGDIALIILFLLTFVFDFWGWMAFYCGTKILSHPSHYIALFDIGSLLLLCFVFGYLYLIIRAFWRLFKNGLFEFLLRVGLLIALPLICINIAKLYDSPPTSFLSGFEVSVNKQVDVYRIQKWLEELTLEKDNQPEENFHYVKNPKGYDENNNATIYLIEPHKQPDFAKVLSRDKPLVVGYDKQNKYYYTGITQYTGNVFIHIRWGLVIGPASMPTPSPYHEPESILYVKQLSPGVYVWRKTDS